MAYVKCALAGIVSGVITAVVWIVVAVFVSFHSMAASGAGGLGAVSGGAAEMLWPGVVGFAVGFYGMLRRQRARTAKA